MNLGHIANRERDSVRFANDDAFDFFRIRHQAHTTYVACFAAFSEITTAHVRAVLLQSGHKFAESQVLVGQSIGVDLNLISLELSTVAVDFGDSRDTSQLIRHLPVEQSPQIHQRFRAVSANFKLENFTQSSRNRPQHGRAITWGNILGCTRQPFGYELAGPIKVCSFVENDGHH